MATIGPQLRALLDRYGLGTMEKWLSDLILSGASEEQIQLELYDRPEFKAVFPEIEARRALAEQQGLHVSPISADDVLTYRSQARALMRSWGLPPEFYAEDKTYYDLIVNDVSLDELNTRLELQFQRVVHAPPEVRTAFGEMFGGAGDSALFALFVDVDRATPALENMVQRAEAQGAARRFGFNLGEYGIDRMEGANITYQQAVQGFQMLDEQRGLFEESLYENEDYAPEVEGVEAAFGLEGGAAGKLARRGEERTASTQGKGGGLMTEQGARGLGGAGRR